MIGDTPDFTEEDEAIIDAIWDGLEREEKR